MDHLNVNTIVPDLCQFFGRAMEVKWKFKPKKFFVGFKMLDFVGHTLSGEGIGTDEAKIQRVVGFQRLEDVSQLRTFLGLAGYYR